MTRHLTWHTLVSLCALVAVTAGSSWGLPATRSADLDQRVAAFLERHRNDWHDLNVPEVDGRTLHALVLEHRYRRALEIGTSTGHSAIWIAWALTKTGGRLTTLEIDDGRRRTALANFREAGLSDYIDSRLGDAHTLVGELEGPFDFIFSDADKGWYAKYLVALWPKLAAGGCFTAHNVATTEMTGIQEFLDRVRALPDGRTSIDRSSSAGLSITYKASK
jgi:caffeoyl-CoA O-methyltransferase